MMIRAALEAYATSTRNSDQRRASTVGASEIGHCMRKTFFVKNADDPLYAIRHDVDYVDSWGAQLRGSTFEDAFWVPALRAKYGDRLKFAGSEQRSFESGFLINDLYDLDHPGTYSVQAFRTDKSTGQTDESNVLTFTVAP